jgi:hypothetical protein
MTNSWLRFWTALGALIATCGCSDLDNCPDARDPITIDRPEATDLETLTYESSAGWESFDEFPAKTELRFKHGLGVVPRDVNAFLSFVPEATNGDGGGSFTEAAGNAVEWHCIDSHTIVIRNGTCERSFYVKVVALGLPSGDTTNEKCGD